MEVKEFMINNPRFYPLLEYFNNQHKFVLGKIGQMLQFFTNPLFDVHSVRVVRDNIAQFHQFSYKLLALLDKISNLERIYEKDILDLGEMEGWLRDKINQYNPSLQTQHQQDDIKQDDEEAKEELNKDLRLAFFKEKLLTNQEKRKQGNEVIKDAEADEEESGDFFQMVDRFKINRKIKKMSLNNNYQANSKAEMNLMKNTRTPVEYMDYEKNTRKMEQAKPARQVKIEESVFSDFFCKKAKQVQKRRTNPGNSKFISDSFINYESNSKHGVTPQNGQINRDKIDKQHSPNKNRLTNLNNQYLGFKEQTQLNNDNKPKDPEKSQKQAQKSDTTKKNSSERKCRGSYNIADVKTKIQAVELSKKYPIKYVSNIMKIPEKNIKRWIKDGPMRKKGAGRKTMDPKMETRLLKWIKDYARSFKRMPQPPTIKEKAKELSDIELFKASKGWFDKFIKRNKPLFDKLRAEGGIDLTDK